MRILKVIADTPAADCAPTVSADIEKELRRQLGQLSEAIQGLEKRLALLETAASMPAPLPETVPPAGISSETLETALQTLRAEFATQAADAQGDLCVLRQDFQALNDAFQRWQEERPAAPPPEPAAASEAPEVPVFDLPSLEMPRPPSIWKRLWAYLNEPAIEVPVGHRRP